MFERFTGVARSIVVGAQQHARDLGHSRIGAEHLLLAAASADSPAGAALRECGLTPERLREHLIDEARSGLFADLDRTALASVGIDLDEVQRRIEATFGPDALDAAGRTRREREPRSLRATLRSLLHATLLRRRRHRRRALIARERPRPGGHIPFSPDAKHVLERSLREALARHDTCIGAEHLALALAATPGGAVPRLLGDLGLSADVVRAAVADRYRAAS